MVASINASSDAEVWSTMKMVSRTP